MRKTLLKVLSGTMMLLAMMAGSSSSSQAQTTVTIGSGTTTTSYYPIYSCYGYNYSQQIYLASEVTAAGWSGGGVISKIRFYQNSEASPVSTYNDWTVYLGNTTQSTFTSSSNWVPVSSMTNVFSGIVTLTGTGWKEITLTTPFTYTGGNLVVAVDENSPSYSCTAAWRSYTSTSGNRAMLYYSDGTNPNPASPPNANNGPGTAMAQFQFDLVSLTPCTGTPAGGTVVSGVPGDSVCSGTPTNLAVTGSSSASGITYQWQSSTDGGTTWTNISGATTSTYAATPSVATCYRRTITCGPSGLSAYSAPVCLTIKTFLGCYCSGTLGGSCGTQSLNKVSITGTSLHNTTTCVTTSGNIYSAFPNSDSFTTTVLKTIPFEFKVSTGNNGNPAQVAVWIDYDHSGTFDASEYTLIAASSPSNTSSNPTFYSSTYNIVVPATALNGLTKMRVRSDWESSPPITATMACSTLPYGETEDYYLTIATATPCAGTPTAALTASVDSTCGGVPLILTATSAGAFTGITYQFQVSIDGGTTWSNIGTASSMYTYTVPSQTVASKYRVIVACSGGGSATSTPVTVLQKSFIGCYCTPASTYTWDNYITNVNFAGINNPSGAAPSGYADYTSSVTAGELLAGIPSPITVNLFNDYGASVAVWIDFDHSGTFDPSEFTSLAGDFSMATTVSGMISVPTGAMAGLARMRVRTQYTYALTATDACNDLPTGYNEGETEDYFVNVSIPVPCTGMPSAALTAGATSVCADEPFALNATSAGAFSGITYLFQVSTDGGTTWTNVAPASSSFSTIVPTQSVASSYRVVVACTGSGMADTSSSVTVGQNPAMACVCVPVYTTGCAVGDDLDGFVLNGDAGSAINNVGVGCVGGSYSDYTSMSVNLLAGSTYSGVVTTTYGGTYENYRIWIDYNDNGVFETSEAVAFGDGIGSSTPGNFTIAVPLAAPGGSHRLRVRLVYSTSGTTIDPCSSYSYGEAHDYTVNIVAPCTAPVVNLGMDTAICAGSSLTLDAGNPGLTYTWSTGATSQTVSVTTAGTYTVSVADGTCVTMDTIVVSVNPLPVVDLGADISGCEGDTLMLNAGNPGATYLWNTGDNTQTINVAATGTYSVSVTTGVCTASDTLSVIVNDYPVVNIGGDTTICAESIIMLNAGNPGATYNWSTGDNTQTIVVNSAATYTVSVTNGVCTTADSITVDESEAPVAGTIAVVNNMPDFEFSVTGTEGAATYLWDFGDGTVANTDTVSKSYTENGTFNVMLIVMNDCGQSDTATTEIIVSGLGIDGLNGAARNIQVYPNPSSGLTVVEAKGAVISTIEVVDNLGRVILRTQPNSIKTVIDVKGMAKGIYTLRIQTSKGMSAVKLVVGDK